VLSRESIFTVNKIENQLFLPAKQMLFSGEEMRHEAAIFILCVNFSALCQTVVTFKETQVSTASKGRSLV
jgi:hypothetical protein